MRPRQCPHHHSPPQAPKRNAANPHFRRERDDRAVPIVTASVALLDRGGGEERLALDTMRLVAGGGVGTHQTQLQSGALEARLEG